MQNDIATQDSHFGKTCPEPLAATRAQTLQKWLSTWQDLTSLTPPRTAGEKKAQRWEVMDCLNGQYWTRNGSDWRNGAKRVFAIVDFGDWKVDRQFYLSAKACEGILRRAEKRGKVLPPMLEQALRTNLGIQ